MLGLLGGLLSPVLVGAPSDATTIGVLALGTACAMWVVLWRRWAWLALAAMVVAWPQWAYWTLLDHGELARLAVISGFAGLGLVGAVFLQLRSDDEQVAGLAAALALLNAIFAGLVGRVALGSMGGALWLAGLGVAHVAVCVWPRPRIALHDHLRRLLIAVGVICADVAVGLGLHGVAQSAAWGAAALGFTWLVRRLGADTADSADAADAADGRWLGAGLAAHVTLVLVRALIAVPPSEVTSGPRLLAVATVAIVAAVCLVSGRVADEWGTAARLALDALGLAAIGYLTLAMLTGAPLVAAWTVEAAALAEIGRRTGDRQAWGAGVCFLTAAAVHTIAVEVPPTALIRGVPSLGAAAIALGALALSSLQVGLADRRGARLRLGMLAGAGVALLSLASVAIVAAFQPDAGAGTTMFLSLGVRQTGQVLLSGLWGIVGVAGLIVGLRRNIAALRLGMLGLLLVTVVKVFLFDLSVLTSIYRVISLFVLGGLLLVGAFAYQRLRPPPVPDMRGVHPSQR